MVSASDDPPSSTEGLPFLVTHWLANFDDSRGGSANDEESRKAAVDRIRNAAAEIASAFSSLGAFGATFPPSLAGSSTLRNATYSDVRRRWSGLLPSHLENLAQAVANTNAVVEATSTTPADLLDVVMEDHRAQSTSGRGSEWQEGRSPQDAIVVGDTAVPSTHPDDSQPIVSSALSIMQPPSRITLDTTTTTTALISKPNSSTLDAETIHASASVPLKAQSSFVEIGQSISESMRKLLELRRKVQVARQEMENANRSISSQAARVQVLNEKYRQLTVEGAGMTQMLQVSDEVKTGKQECERVTAQLQRKLVDWTSALCQDEAEMVRLEKEVKLLDERQKGAARTCRDSYWSWAGDLAPGSRVGANPILRTVLGRQMGWSRSRNALVQAQSSILSGHKTTHFLATRKALLMGRFSHAATINAHLSYPVYCLRFDRTGRYFISGADDYLIKVFHLGSGQSCQNKNPRNGSRLHSNNYGANLRGAVLVCSLRGHAGVINDIDVSSDNALLATASVDGDVRVWGLKDGSPVAILRGHKEGANMVSWSKLTPYRLISTGSDGFARIWDVREACLQRYGASVGKRSEYRLKLADDEKNRLQALVGSAASAEYVDATLPAIPARQSLPIPMDRLAGDLGNASQNAPSVEDVLGVVVPPLPEAVPPLPGDPVSGNAAANDPSNGEGEIAQPGQFVANDEIDEGVKLLRKFKHGSTGPEVVGPGTRSRRATVNVICVARCPFGFFFATGSDDGLCRVFGDMEELGVGIVDQRSDFEMSASFAVPYTPTSNEPVLKLKGHVSAITDLSYSSSGDRILSASQKDGVVRIWAFGRPVLDKKAENSISQIVIKLVDPGSLASRSRPQPSRRLHGGSNRNDASNVSCDVAVWTHDDGKIITSQSLLVKQSGSDIQPGSQYIFLWDSRSGQCLLGISGAHTMQCPVVVPHPTDSSLVCTAGADGVAKLWDWQSGNCIFSHTNNVEFGPIEPSETVKTAGYLDGSFNADGTTLVLTDDAGRLTIFDSLAEDNDSTGRDSPPWMREQYFANDYYDLVYDRSGYCIERGSECPPHLAPRGARCDHSGTPWSDIVNEAFSKIVGPSPLPENVCRWQRGEVRRRALSAIEKEYHGSDTHAFKVPRGVSGFDPSTTILIKGPGAKEVVETRVPRASVESPRMPTIQSSARNESANWRYLDYDDMIRLQGNQDEEEPDSDDEEFSPTIRNRGRSTHSQSDDSENDDMDLDDLETESSSRPARNGAIQNAARAQRSRRRSQPLDVHFLDLGSEDEVDDQIMSTNNIPSGPFVSDYVEKGHFWRMPNSNMRGMWLKRHESDTSYQGRKIYTPQLGDSVVYIPRAHYQTLKMFPSLEPPWQHWPQGTAWPVVRCCVRGVRFRFPYQDYYRSSNHRSLVAILILEVTGIPELSANREFPWPKPLFVESTTGFVFELSLFENHECEYVFPEGLYVERLQALEGALRNRRQPFGLGISAYFAPERGREDCEMESSPGRIVTMIPEEESSSDPHMAGSGFGVVRVDFGDSWADDFSPWDLCMPNLSISRPQLSEEDKKLVLEKLDVQCQKNDVAQHFNLGVDTTRYCDYERMVEVEMFLMIVKRRLGKDYYGSKFAVVQDLRLIRDNCIKYNGSDHDLVAIASNMCSEFETALLSEAEASFLRESDTLTLSRYRTTGARRTPTIRIRLAQRTTQVAAHQHQQNQGRSTREPRMQRQSSLENLPAPEVDRRIQPPRRGRARIVEASTSSRSAAVPDHGRSLRPRGQANLESLSRLGVSNPRSAGVAESRSSRYARRQAVGHAQHDDAVVNGEANQLIVGVRVTASQRAAASTPQRPARSTRSRTRYADLEDSDVEQESSRPSRSARVTRTAARNKVGSEDDMDGHSSSESDQHSEEEESDDGAAQPITNRRVSTRGAAAVPSSVKSNGTRVTRTAARNKVGLKDDVEDHSSSESDDQLDEDESDGSVVQPITSRRGSNRRAASSPSRVKSKGARTSRAHSSPPTRARPRASHDDPSDFEPEESEVDDGSEEEMSSPRASKRKVKSYAEIPSDFDEEDENSEDAAPSAGRSSQKRKRAASPRKNPTKKKKDASVEKIALKSWPNIPIKDITRVSRAILAKVFAVDIEGHFGTPVLESFPQLANDYLEVVDDPMDFRTIEEERMPQYKKIKDLQTDLCLVFDNCSQFNGVNTEMDQYAVKIRNQLNTFFAEACEEEDVSIGRWHP